MSIRNCHPLLIGLALMLTACSSVRYEGPKQGTLSLKDVRVLLIPFDNATDSESASVALTEMTASALDSEGVNYSKAEDRLPPKPAEGEQQKSWFEVALEGNHTHLLRGSVTEYHYKTDLDGDPAVGVSMRLIQVATERTVWQGSSSATGYGYASLSSAGQQAVNKLVLKMFKDSSAAKRE